MDSKYYISEQKQILKGFTMDGKSLAKTRTYLLKSKYGIAIVIQRLLLAEIKDKDELESVSYTLLRKFKDKGLFETRISFKPETFFKIVNFLTNKQ